jgi:hypothetical protein
MRPITLRSVLVCLDSMRINPLKHNDYYTYHLFNIKKLCTIPEHCIFVFHMILSKNAVFTPREEVHLYILLRKIRASKWI